MSTLNTTTNPTDLDKGYTVVTAYEGNALPTYRIFYCSKAIGEEHTKVGANRAVAAHQYKRQLVDTAEGKTIWDKI